MVFIPLITLAQSYEVKYIIIDSASHEILPPLQKSFPNKITATEYFYNLTPVMQKSGFVVASVDSITYDSTNALVELYLGKKYLWANIVTLPKDNDLLEALQWKDESFKKKPLSFSQLSQKQEALLSHLEEKGHPFGKVYLDSIQINGDEVAGILRINRGPLYRIDSIRLYGDAKVSNLFLQRYLDIGAGSTYNQKKISNISKKLAAARRSTGLPSGGAGPARSIA